MSGMIENKLSDSHYMLFVPTNQVFYGSGIRSKRFAPGQSLIHVLTFPILPAMGGTGPICEIATIQDKGSGRTFLVYFLQELYLWEITAFFLIGIGGIHLCPNFIIATRFERRLTLCNGSIHASANSGGDFSSTAIKGAFELDLYIGASLFVSDLRDPVNRPRAGIAEKVMYGRCACFWEIHDQNGLWQWQ